MKSSLSRGAFAVLALLVALTPRVGTAADIDIYGSPGTAGAAPNVMFLLDNSSDWSSLRQNWNSIDSLARCAAVTQVAARRRCENVVAQIYYAGDRGRSDRVELTQGQVQLRSLKLALNELVCSGSRGALAVNVGLAMFSDRGSALSGTHTTAFIRFAVRRLSGTATTVGSTCKAIVDDLDFIDGRVAQDFTAVGNANYGGALFEIFKYFGGYTNPTLAAAATVRAGAPVSRSAYGRGRYTEASALADPNAFEGNVVTSTTYKNLFTTASACASSYVVVVGNDYPSSEGQSGGDPAVFNGLDYTPPALRADTADADRSADEWSYFLANTDVSDVAGVQRVLTYAINTYKDSPSQAQHRLMRSMAGAGGVGPAGYFDIAGDLVGLVDAFREILINIAAVDSVFTATTLPVSTTTQGTYLNQVFVGMFRPDADGGARWVGNLKQYQLGLFGDNLDLVDARGRVAIATTGFFSPLAESFWTAPSVYFAAAPSGSPPSASDLPDGPIVEKGGAAQMLRIDNLTSSANRNVYTLPSSPTSGLALSATPFAGTTTEVAAAFSAEEIAWVRGEANITSGQGAEALVGSRQDGDSIVLLDTAGARHSIHGDVLHSRPVAVNYGDSGVVVYYGSNDGHFRAIDGSLTGTTAGHEMWSFIAPEHYGLLRRQRAASPLLHLPETTATGAATVASGGNLPKDYMMDGPIGVYARYNAAGTAVTEAFIYPSMRRGGRTVYAFDVTDKANPKFMWRITGGTGSYEKLAQTWSMPKPVVFPSTSSSPPVILLMGGGYDPSEDTNTSSGIGNVVYVINGRTGERIAAFQTAFSVPSDVTVTDADNDGVPDRAYVADVRGNLYRINFPRAGADVLAPSSWSSITASRVAELGGKVFFAPDAVVTREFVAVLLGTGDREKPLRTSTTDNFFLIKDNLADTPAATLTRSSLTRIARIDNSTMRVTDVVSPAVSAPGCYIQLATNGEKVVNAPFTIAGRTFFGTNRPRASSSTTCFADQGQAFSYSFPLFCGEPTVTRLNFSGLPPSPVGGFVEIADPALGANAPRRRYPFLIGGGDNVLSPFSATRVRSAVSLRRTRLYWRLDNSNR